MKIKQFVILFAVMACFVSCTQWPEPYVLGQRVAGQDCRALNNYMYTPDWKLVASDVVEKDGVSYVLGYDTECRLYYCETTDTDFSVDGMRVGEPLKKGYWKSGLKYSGGWGYYIYLGHNWYAYYEDTPWVPDATTAVNGFFMMKVAETVKK